MSFGLQVVYKLGHQASIPISIYVYISVWQHWNLSKIETSIVGVRNKLAKWNLAGFEVATRAFQLPSFSFPAQGISEIWDLEKRQKHEKHEIN